jgi:uncharacterized protein YbbC (DUF1343 family)
VLKDADVLICGIQDVEVRFYTFVSSMGEAKGWQRDAQRAARHPR